MENKAVAVSGAVILSVLGWALGTLTNIVHDQRVILYDTKTRISVLETKFKRHEERNHQ
jgi:hypothetical protein